MIEGDREERRGGEGQPQKRGGNEGGLDDAPMRDLGLFPSDPRRAPTMLADPVEGKISELGEKSNGNGIKGEKVEVPNCYSVAWGGGLGTQHLKPNNFL